MANVTVIPAKPVQELKGLKVTAKLRVCAYCRVSTDNEEQVSSYERRKFHTTQNILNAILSGNSAEFLRTRESVVPTLRNGWNSTDNQIHQSICQEYA